MLSRRGLLFGLGASLMVAPAIVHASNLMPIKNFVILPRTRKFKLELDQNKKIVVYKASGGEQPIWIDSNSAAYGKLEDESYWRYLDIKDQAGWDLNYHEAVDKYWQSKADYVIEPTECRVHKTLVDGKPMREMAFSKESWIEQNRVISELRKTPQYTKFVAVSGRSF